MTFQNFRDVTKVILKGKVLAKQTYLNKQEKPQINNLL